MNASGESIVMGSTPIVCSCDFTWGAVTALTSAPCSFSRIGCGVFAGASTANQLTASTFGRPSSAEVGISGRSGLRSSESIASGRSLPDFTCGKSTGKSMMMPSMWPPMASVAAGPAPLKGTCSRSMPASLLNSSMARCGSPPLPDEANVILPGRCFASAMSSCSDLGGNEGWIAISSAVMATVVMPAKSRTVSYGMLGYVKRLSTSGLALPSVSV